MRYVLVAVAIAATLGSTAALADDAQPPAQQATIVEKIVKRPARVVRRFERFHVPSRPTPDEVRRIIGYEAAKWGVSVAALSRRVACESRYLWWASNGRYQGVLQFGPDAFYRGLASIRTRRVKVTEVRMRRMHSRVYRTWSDGHTTRSKGRTVRQRVITTRMAMLPRHPSITDAWIQIRIGAQALRGISAVRSSEWACAA